jgi:recombination protein RecT
MAESKALQTINTQAVVGNFTQKELDTLKATIARGTSNEQFALFVQTCASSGLNPFLNQIYCITYDGKHGPVMSIQIAVEGIISLAKRHPQYKGFIASEVKENDHFEIDMVTGEPVHKITSMQRGKTIGAYCVAYREEAPNMAVIITSDQVEHLVKGRNGQMWKDYFDDMIVKHAIKRAFKRQFGIEVAEDDLSHQGSTGDSIPEYKPQERKDITPNAEVIEAPKPNNETDQLNQLIAEINAKFKKLGITTKQAKNEYTMKHVPDFKATLAGWTGLSKLLDMHIDLQEAQDELPLDDDQLE